MKTILLTGFGFLFLVFGAIGMLVLSAALIRSIRSLLLLTVVGIAVTIHLVWMAKAKEKGAS